MKDMKPKRSVFGNGFEILGDMYGNWSTKQANIFHCFEGFSAEIYYFYSWKVERMLLEDEVFITLKKL